MSAEEEIEELAEMASEWQVAIGFVDHPRRLAEKLHQQIPPHGIKSRVKLLPLASEAFARCERQVRAGGVSNPVGYLLTVFRKMALSDANPLSRATQEAHGLSDKGLAVEKERIRQADHELHEQRIDAARAAKAHRRSSAELAAKCRAFLERFPKPPAWHHGPTPTSARTLASLTADEAEIDDYAHRRDDVQQVDELIDPWELFDEQDVIREPQQGDEQHG